jgi:hypothetical protein
MISEALMLPPSFAKKQPHPRQQQQQSDKQSSQAQQQQSQHIHPIGAALALTAALELARPLGRQQQQQQQPQQHHSTQQGQHQILQEDSTQQPHGSQRASALQHSTQTCTAATAATAQRLHAALHACFVYDARQLLSHVDRARSSQVGRTDECVLMCMVWVELAGIACLACGVLGQGFVSQSAIEHCI